MKNGEVISVVLQGPVHGKPGDPPERQLTRQCVEAVRKLWPAGEVILSTWRGADATGLGVDRVVENDDPGATPINDGQLKAVFNNLNRQIVSTQGGLAQATRPFALKLRTDCLLRRAPDFAALDRAPRAAAWRIFGAPILTLNLHTCHPLRRPVLGFVSDIFHAGRLADVRLLWSVPLVSEPAFTRAIDPQRRPPVNAFPEGDYLMRCAPEQYLGEQLVQRKQPAFRLAHISDADPARLETWLHVLANNFVIQPPAAIGLELPAHIAKRSESWDLLRPRDAAWLAQWQRDASPWLARTTAAWRLRVLQIAFRAPPFQRARWQQALGRLVRETT